MSRKTLVFHSALDPNILGDTLRRTIDPQQRALFSLSGFKGERPLLGEVRQDTFRLRKRRYYKNDFARQFHARFMPEPGGTRIEAYFDIPRLARYYMWFWLAGAVLIGVPIFIYSMLDITTGSQNIHGDKWVGFIVPPALILFGIFLPRIGLLIGRGEERYILQYVQETLVARMEEPSLSPRQIPTAR